MVVGRAHLSVVEVHCGLLVPEELVRGVRVRPDTVGQGPVPFLLPDADGQHGQTDVDVFESVQQENPHDDGQEAAESPDDIVVAHVLPLFKQDGGAGEH